MSAYELIRTEAASFPVKRMCRLLEVSRSGYYDHVVRRARPQRHERLVAKTRASTRRVKGPMAFVVCTASWLPMVSRSAVVWCGG